MNYSYQFEVIIRNNYIAGLPYGWLNDVDFDNSTREVRYIGTTFSLRRDGPDPFATYTISYHNRLVNNGM